MSWEGLLLLLLTFSWLSYSISYFRPQTPCGYYVTLNIVLHVQMKACSEAYNISSFHPSDSSSTIFRAEDYSKMFFSAPISAPINTELSAMLHKYLWSHDAGRPWHTCREEYITQTTISLRLSVLVLSHRLLCMVCCFFSPNYSCTASVPI